MFTKDAKASLKLVNSLEAKDASYNTRVQYLLRLRKLSERADEPMVDLDHQSMQALFDKCQSGKHPDVKDDGIQMGPYKTFLQSFENRFPLACEPEDLEATHSQGRDLDPEDLLYREDIDAMFQEFGMDVRYKAFVAWGLATGQRLDAIRTVKLKDVQVDGKSGEIRLNTKDGALKGASGEVPLLWARQYVERWIDIHPYKDVDDAALFCADPRINRGSREREMWEPLQPDPINRRLKRVAERAGIDKDVYPHLLRHTAITRMVLNPDLNEQQVKDLVGWSASSEQFDTYVTLADDFRNASIRDSLGYETNDKDLPILGRPTFDKCPACDHPMDDDGSPCGACGFAFNQGQRIQQEKHEEQAENAFDKVLDEASNDPEKAVELIESLKDELT